MIITLIDADDQNPIFSHEIYTASVTESAQITVSIAIYSIHNKF